MRKNLKKFTPVMILMLLIFLFTGCSKSSSQKTDDAAVKSKQPVKLVVWVSAVVNQGFTDLIANWEAKHPDVKVETVQFVNDDTGNTKLDTALMSGEQIDAYITFGIPVLSKRIDGGMAEKLDSYGAADFIKQNFGDSGIFKSNNFIYSIPIAKEPQYFVINKSAFDNADISVPKKWSLQEFIDTAQKLTTKKDGKTQYAMIGTFDLARMKLGDDYWYKSDGTSNFDNPAFKESFQFYYDMMYKYKVAIPYDEVLSRKLQTFAQDAFMHEDASMWVNSTWVLQYVKDAAKYPHNWVTTFAPLPTLNEGKDNNPGMKNNWISINGKSQNKEDAWEFLKYWSTEGAASYSYISKTSKITSWNTAKQEDIIKAVLGENPEKLFDVNAFKLSPQLDPNVKLIVDTQTKGAAEIQQILKEETDKYYLKEQTIDKLISNLKTRADAAIKNAAK